VDAIGTEETLMATTTLGARPRSRAAHRLARGLGWLSLALGAAKIAAPDALARSLGMKRQRHVIRASGMRELVTGAGALSTLGPTPWIWSRFVGGAIEAGALLRGLRGHRRHRRNVAIAMGLVAGIAALDMVCTRKLAQVAR
jgi:hypothetical protein